MSCSDHDSSDFFFSIIGTMGVKRTCKTTDGEQLFCKKNYSRILSQKPGVHYISHCTVIFGGKQYIVDT